MQPILYALVLAAQPLGSADCIYEAVPVSTRFSIGDAVLAKRTKSVADNEVLRKVTDDCARQNHWSVEQAVHANGYSAMRFAAETIASKLGHPQWSLNALEEIRGRPTDQLANLAGVGSGGAEFELILSRMIGKDQGISVLKEESKENLESFILMIKLLAVAEIERRKV